MRQGILGELLEPIMGKGLIPADPVTWRQRRPQIVPAFHRKWLEYMIGEFAYCNSPLIDSLNKIADTTGKVEMEEKFCSVALDIIGKKSSTATLVLLRKRVLLSKQFTRHLSKLNTGP